MRRTVAAWAVCLVVIGIFVSRFVIPAARNPNTVGFVAYYTESRVLLENAQELPRVYDDAWLQARVERYFGRRLPEGLTAQSPLMSLIMLPLAWLSPGSAKLVWTLASLGLWVAGLALLARGLRIERLFRVPAAVALTALTTVYTPLRDNLRQGQGYALLFFLLALAVRPLLDPRPGRRWLAGLPLGLMLALKTAGVWLVAQLAVARQGLVVAVTLSTVAVTAAAWSAVMGVDMWRPYLAGYAWVATNPGVTAHQTVTSLVSHLLVFDPSWNLHPLAHLPRLARAITILVTAAIFLTSARLQRLRDGSFEARALTVGMWVAPLVSLAPVATGGHHYLLVFPALLIAWRRAMMVDAPARSRLLLALLTALVCAPQRYYGAAWLADGARALLAYPRVYGALGVWAWLAAQLARSGGEEPDPEVAALSRLRRESG